MDLNINNLKPVKLWGYNEQHEEITAPGVMDADGIYLEDGTQLDGEFIYDCRWAHVGYSGEPVHYDGGLLYVERIFLEILPGRFDW